MRLASAFVALLALQPLARAAPDDARDQAARTALGDQVTAELETIDKTLATVNDKLTAAQVTRIRRVRAAYRILRAQLSSDASPSDRMASARRRAAARLLLDRDRDERSLLENEAQQLSSAREATLRAESQVPMVMLPESLLAPVRGTIARTFGTLVHDGSKATLSRRGLDFDVEPNAPVVAPEGGTVRYAGPMRGLDHGVILDHGDYFTIVAKLGELAIPVGTKVARGDRIGRAARQRVYLELRAKVGPGGLPVDPQPLLEGSPTQNRP